MKGSGFAWMPETAVADEIASGDLVQIADDRWTARLMIVALANATAFDPAAQEVWRRL